METVDFLNYLAIVPILLILMVAHEFGHFIVAKRSGITVEEFAIGFPPRLFSIERGGVQYSLNLIPLGAYVKMLGEEDPSDPGSFAAQSKRIRALVLVAGSAMNFLLAIAVLSIGYGIGWPEALPQVTQVVEDSPAAAAGLQAGDVILKLDDIQMKSMEQFSDETNKHRGQQI